MRLGTYVHGILIFPCPQIGAYYGYSVAGVDFNGDQ